MYSNNEKSRPFISDEQKKLLGQFVWTYCNHSWTLRISVFVIWIIYNIYIYIYSYSDVKLGIYKCFVHIYVEVQLLITSFLYLFYTKYILPNYMV